jgi:uncharacterized membrane protein YphA (DoxX/SURF4 family)
MSKRRRSKPVLSPLYKWGSIALGVLFLVAGVSKVLDPWSFHAALPGYGITGAFRSLVSVVVPALEIVLGVALVTRWRVRQASLAASAFLGVFIVAISVGWWRGALDECGCFGAILERSPPETIAIDVLFLALAVTVWRGSAAVGRGLKNKDWQENTTLAGAGVCAAVVTLLLLLAGPSGLRATEGGDPNPEMRSVDLSQGKQLLYLFHHECPQCAQMSPLVAEYTRDPALPPVVGFTIISTRHQIDTYRDRYGLRIPVQNLPRKQFTRITGDGSVPQLVFVRDGEIVRTWATVFPDADELNGLLAGE